MSLLRRIENRGSGGGNEPGNTGGAAGGDDSEESKLAAMRQRRQVVGEARPASSRNDNSYMDLKARVQNKLLSELDSQAMDVKQRDKVRTHIEELFNSILADESLVLSRAERQRLFEAIVADILGFGPLEILLADD